MLTDPVPWIDQWPITYPCRTGPWTVTDGERWGIVDPADGRPVVVNPADDPKLIELPNALNEGRLFSYRHHRRAVIVTEHGYTKVTAPKKIEAIAQRHHLASQLGLNGPGVTGHHPGGRIDLHKVPGRSVHEQLTGQGISQAQIVATAGVIAELHQHQPRGLPRHNPSPSWIETTRRAAPAFAEELRRVFDRLPPAPDSGDRLIHSDLHDKNVLLYGDKATLIDLDGLSLGDPAVDLGNLTAHLTLRAMQGRYEEREARQLNDLLLRSYATKCAVDMDAVSIVQRHTWLRLSALYHFRKASRHLVPALIRLSATGAT